MKRCRTGLGIVSLAICLGALVACAPRATDDGTPRPGLWRATLQLPGGELPFGLEFEIGRAHV